jgi:hypothetical protein
MTVIKQVIKYPRKNYPTPKPVVEEKVEEQEKPVVKNNKRTKKETDMNDKVTVAEELAQNLAQNDRVKVVKKDKGLIERTESSKIVLTEDNRQVLND